MTHAYPPHPATFSYVGKHRYFLTFSTHDRRPILTKEDVVQLVLTQVLRAAGKHGFEVTAYCFMPDHLHLLIEGRQDASDCRAFIRAAKQYSGFYFKQKTGTQLWQRYGHERVLRSDEERATTITYIVENPIEAKLAEHPSDYPFLGSQRYSLRELLEQAAPSPSGRRY